MATLAERFGERVHKLREKSKMSQLELAQKAKVDLTTINEIENGNREPMLKTIWKIANALKVDLPDLFEFHSVRYSENDFSGYLVRDTKAKKKKH